jgi:hypothetical protein
VERVGYRLRIREPDWYEHRCLVRRIADGAPYDVNLHVFPADLGAVEIERILVFRDWLRSHETVDAAIPLRELSTLWWSAKRRESAGMCRPALLYRHGDTWTVGIFDADGGRRIGHEVVGQLDQ